MSDKVGDRFSTLDPDFTFNVSCMTEAHNFETARIVGLPYHPLFFDIFNKIASKGSEVPVRVLSIGSPA